MTERELLHKWLGGQSGEFIQKHGRQEILDILAVVERRRGNYVHPDPDERILGREAKTPCYVTFYTAAGHALRETMVSTTMNHMDGRLHAQINRKAKELGAHHWAIFKHWVNFDVPIDEATD